MSEKLPKVVYVPVGDLVPMESNPRKNAEAVPKVMASIQRFGWTNPILARREDRVVIAGHTRLEAAKRLGLEKAPVIWLDLDPVSARLYNLADNKLNEVAEWDDEALSTILAELLAEDAQGVAIAGFSEADLDTLLRQVGGSPSNEDPDDVPEVAAESWVKPGDLFQLGEHKLLCGDSTRPEDVARVMAGERASCMWTDPPYGVNYKGKAGTISNDGAEGLEALLNGAFAAANDALEDGASIYVAHPAGANSVTFGVSFIAAGWRLHETLVWVKDSLVLGHSDYHYRHEPILFGYRPAKGRRGRGGEGWYGDDSQTTVFEVPRPKRSEDHPCLRPGSFVLTACGWRPIEWLLVGEQVLTAEGTYESVEDVSSHHCDGPLVRIHVEGIAEAVDATGNHPFLVARDGALAWVEASQLLPGDELATPAAISRRAQGSVMRSQHPSGTGYTTPKGYHRVRHAGRLRMAHVVAWERAHGPVPAGFQVHHKDGGKQNNELSNLELVTPLEHKRLHSGCELRDGVWWKPCRLCCVLKPVTAEHWYFNPRGWVMGFGCRPCHIARVVAIRSARRRQRRASPLQRPGLEPERPGQPDIPDAHRDDAQHHEARAAHHADADQQHAGGLGGLRAVLGFGLDADGV